MNGQTPRAAPGDARALALEGLDNGLSLAMQIKFNNFVRWWINDGSALALEQFNIGLAQHFEAYTAAREAVEAVAPPSPAQQQQLPPPGEYHVGQQTEYGD